MIDDPNQQKIIKWLLSGDMAIRYQTHKDLLNSRENIYLPLQTTIATHGWGKKFMSHRHANGHWGRSFYQPKWTSTHYTLLDLKNIGYPPDCEKIAQSVLMVLACKKGKSGGINFSSMAESDVCINGMILNYASYFIKKHPALNETVDYLLNVQMKDGGWNCQYKNNCVHSSMHSTMSVLEGLSEFETNSEYRNTAIKTARNKAIKFLLRHQLFRSHKTGNIISQQMLAFSFPCRWKYDVLRALDYLQVIKFPYDKMLQPALDHLLKKQKKSGYWNTGTKHKGEVHFDMEQSGRPGRWNTLRALRVLKHFNQSVSTP